jgi:hypothetical protein
LKLRCAEDVWHDVIKKALLLIWWKQGGDGSQVTDHGIDTGLTDGFLPLAGGLRIGTGSARRIETEAMGAHHFLTHGITAGEVGTVHSSDLGKAIIRDLILMPQPFEADALTAGHRLAQFACEMVADGADGDRKQAEEEKPETLVHDGDQ